MTESGSAANERRQVVIAGTGIAGLSAAIYAARANSDPLVLEGDEPGGQLTLTTDVANYPGFPEGISGPDLINRMKEQARNFGAEIDHGVLESVSPGEDGDPHRLVLADDRTVMTDVLIVASGASARTLDVPGEDELMGYGVSTCATCDGAFFRDQEVMVVGGGDAAMEEATFLTKFASTVHLAHRREAFRAEAYWTDRLDEQVEAGDIDVIKNTEVIEVAGSPEEGLDHVTLAHNPAGHPSDKPDDPETETTEFDVDGLFIAIGHTPNTAYLDETPVETDEIGYVLTEGGRNGGRTATDVPGIFAAGDVVDHHYQQAITAGGMGSQAALDADAYLDSFERPPGTDAEAGTTTAASDD
jgi:thioredoxin reductase (NADPH)